MSDKKKLQFDTYAGSNLYRVNYKYGNAKEVSTKLVMCRDIVDITESPISEHSGTIQIVEIFLIESNISLLVADL